MPASINITGQRFSRLVAIRRVPSDGRPNTRWEFLCDCGSTVIVLLGAVRRGSTKSCGCIRRETCASQASNRFTHRMTNTPTYRSWSAMRGRCTRPNDPAFDRYGGRGIKVCDRWLNSFENFLEDMGERPEGKTLDRENNDGNYEPGNCRWATRIEQQNNRRNSRKIDHNGLSLTAAEWTRKLGLGRGAVTTRLFAGWTVERALSDGVTR